MRNPKSEGVLPRKIIEEMLGCGEIYFTSVRSASDRSHISPTLIGLFPVRLPTGKEEMVLERGETREFDLNVGVGNALPDYYFFGDGNTTAARAGLSVDITDSDGMMLPYQPATKRYPDHVSPHPKNGGLTARVTALQFPVRIRPGSSIANLRIFHGDPEASVLDPHSLGDVLYVDGHPLPADELLHIRARKLGMRLNLAETVHNGSAGYVSRECSRALRYEKEANDPAYFYETIAPCSAYVVKPGTHILLYTHESIDLTGKNGDGKPIVGFMRRKLNGYDKVNSATMLEPEPPKRLAVEIQPSGEKLLYHKLHICDAMFYKGCDDLDIKDHNSGNRHPLGKLFRLNGY